MFKEIFSYIFRSRKKDGNKFISQKELEAYMYIEGVRYVDIFPPFGLEPRNRTRDQEYYVMGQVKPQVLLALLFLGSITLYAINMSETSIATATIGGLIALGMKILERD